MPLLCKQMQELCTLRALVARTAGSESERVGRHECVQHAREAQALQLLMLESDIETVIFRTMRLCMASC